ncbi:TrmH family RNA methyltransferase [Allorhizobium pseudoryzae]|uniref:TrmH family RNA methyltransferase n=1 Tax=Allorhizobium pseudoryzae TaxID=379684 RepID=UPI003D084761
MPVPAREIIRIEDAGDPRIAEFRDIKEKDLVGRAGGFIAEGTVVLRMLAAAHAADGPFRAEKVLLLENRVAGLGELLEAFPAEVPVYVASGAVLDAIAGFHLHRGVLALGRRLCLPEVPDLLRTAPDPALVVIACGISNHDNLGAIFRNAAAFGASAVLMDDLCCDPLYRKALRVSVGAVLSVPYARGGQVLDLLQTVDRAGFAIWGLSPRGAVDLRDIPPARGIALVTGTEGEGLPPEVLARFRSARIPQRPGLDSLNAATATGIALYEIARLQRLI